MHFHPFADSLDEHQVNSLVVEGSSTTGHTIVGTGATHNVEHNGVLASPVTCRAGKGTVCQHSTDSTARMLSQQQAPSNLTAKTMP